MRLGLVGDTMLGRGVAEAVERHGARDLFAPDVVAAAREADLVVANLECCVSRRGEPWPAPGKPFFFRAPPEALDALEQLGVDCVTLANNHALDFGVEALADTLEHLAARGIVSVGAGPDVVAARRPARLERAGARVCVVAMTDHPRDMAAGPDRPGVAWADLRREVPSWVRDRIRRCRPGADVVLVAPHWGPNMVVEPVPHVRAAAAVLDDEGATLVAGHSAHVFHGAAGRVLFDLGDLVDDYARDPVLRNDLGLLWLVDLGPGRDERGLVPTRVEAVPLRLDHCRTSRAAGEDARWIAARLRDACRALGSDAREEQGRLVVDLAA